jgi:ribonuclease HI
MDNIIIYLLNNDYVQSLILFFQQIIFIIALILVIIWSISYGFIRGKQTTAKAISFVNCEDTSINSIEQQEEETVNTIPISSVCASESNQIDKPTSEVPIIASNAFPIDEENTRRSSRLLSCYCDGSYSHRNQIGYSGFRTSNGFSNCRRCPRRGSTESEVFAACLALEYTAKHDYDRLILHTDNSKVEQLLKRPKANKDYNDYPQFFTALDQCRKKQGFDIHVERVRGHTTRYEQQQCSTKREFAKVDRQVRRKRQNYERYKNSSPIAYSYRCGTFTIITSNSRVLSYF